MAGDEDMPREAFQRLRDSSFWSGMADVRRKLFMRTTIKNICRIDQVACVKRWEKLAREEKRGGAAG